MNMLERIFGRKGQPEGLKSARKFQLLEGYTPAFTTWNGSVYESELIRSGLDAWGRHAAKLKPNLKGSALPELQNRLRVRPNEFQEWSKFLYQTATVLGARNNVFLVKTRNDDGTPNGIINIIPQKWELVEYAGSIYIRFELANNKRRAEKLKDIGIMTRFQFKSELFGENNSALNPVLDLISLQRQGIGEGIKNGASYRFSAIADNWASDEDLAKEMERFNKFTFANKKNGGGVLLFPNTYSNVQQIKQESYKIDAEQQKNIETSIFNYLGVNENILQNKAIGDEWLAFYEGFVEWFAIQLGEVISGMLFTDRERIGFNNQIFFSSNRLQYMSNADKLNAVTQLGDRGLATRNELREILNLDPLPDDVGNQIPARGEYYDVTNPPENKIGEKDQKPQKEQAEDEERTAAESSKELRKIKECVSELESLTTEKQKAPVIEMGT